MQINSGLMWYDNSVRISFEQKLQEAVGAYERKFGRRANICYVNPKDLPEPALASENVQILPEPTILSHHFFVGATGARR